MPNKTIPEDLMRAAKRGFIRTTAQAYSTSLAGGISASAVLSYVTDNPNWGAISVVVGVALLSPLLAGLSSFLNIISSGIPEDYLAVEEV